MDKNNNNRLLLFGGTILGVVLIVLGSVFMAETAVGRILRDVGLFTAIVCGFNCLFNLSGNKRETLLKKKMSRR